MLVVIALAKLENPKAIQNKKMMGTFKSFVVFALVKLVKFDSFAMPKRPISKESHYSCLSTLTSIYLCCPLQPRFILMIKKESDRFKIRKALVLNNGKTAGYLLASKRRFVFIYDSDYLANGGHSIAIGFPKAQRIFSSKYLFPFFSGLLPEGENLAYTCRCLKLDPTDKFNLLLELAQHETIGAITVQKMTAENPQVIYR